MWTASAGTRNGSGRFYADGKYWVAHRFAYFIEHGEDIPEGMQLGHLCRRLKCVNVLHLEPAQGDEIRTRCMAVRPLQLTCPHGHLWTRQNIYINKRGHRRCKKCRVISVAAARRKKSNRRQKTKR